MNNKFKENDNVILKNIDGVFPNTQLTMDNVPDSLKKPAQIMWVHTQGQLNIGLSNGLIVNEKNIEHHFDEHETMKTNDEHNI